MSSRTRDKIWKACLFLLGGFGVLHFFWSHCPVYPEKAFWKMAIAMIPLLFLTAIWTAVIGVILMPLLWMYEEISKSS